MKKVDHNPRNKVAEPQFSDSDYVTDMRVDPLTTMDQIKSEISELEERRKEREAAKLEAEQKQADDEAQEVARLRAAAQSGNAPQTPAANVTASQGLGLEESQ